MADIASRISDAMVPGFLGLVVALAVYGIHRYLRGQLQTFHLETKSATIDLVNYLASCRPGLEAQDAPRFRTVPSYRHALLEFIWPRLLSDGGRDAVLRASGWVCFAYGVVGFLVYWDLHRLISGWVLFSFFAYAGWLITRQPIASAVAVFAFFAAMLLLCFLSPFDLGMAEFFLALAPVLLIGSLKAGAGHVSAETQWLRVTRCLLLAVLCAGACAVVSAGTIFYLYGAAPDQGGMYPTIRGGDWVVSWMSPPPRIFRGELLQTPCCPVRVIGLPGDRLMIQGGTLIRNGEAVREPYSNRFTNPFADFPVPSNLDADARRLWKREMPHDKQNDREFLVPEGRYFILNDNRNLLDDSRNNGTVAREYLGGRLILAWSPSRKSLVLLR